MTNVATGSVPSDLSLVVIQLFKGPLYRDSHEKLWDSMLRLRARVSDYVATIGLLMEVDESDGYAYLRSRPDDGDVAYPRLVVRHTLAYHVSLLLALLRKRMAEFDATSPEARLVLTREQIVELIRVHLPDSNDEVRSAKAVDGYLKRVEELGFVQRLRGDDDRFEVKRILRAFVDGQWLADFDRRLDEYLGTANDDIEEIAFTGSRSSTGARSTSGCGPSRSMVATHCSPVTSGRANRRSSMPSRRCCCPRTASRTTRRPVPRPESVIFARTCSVTTRRNGTRRPAARDRSASGTTATTRCSWACSPTLTSTTT
jgi:hypothetical protein